jgi:hypothetical protein
MLHQPGAAHPDVHRVVDSGGDGCVDAGGAEFPDSPCSDQARRLVELVDERDVDVVRDVGVDRHATLDRFLASHRP